MRTQIILLAMLTGALTATAADETNSPSSGMAAYVPAAAPQPSGLLLHHGDRLAICGDSITEQKMYSRLIEDYLTMCVPQLDVTVRQYGWSGEKAPEFLARMTNDVLRFKPTIATTCYGMNDHEYRTYEDRIGETYRTSSDAIVRSFKDHGARVVLGAAGCVGKVPPWQRDRSYTVDELNFNLGTLRNIDIGIAKSEKVGFADVFWPMYNAGIEARQKYSANYNISGNDGVHPNWAGHTVMAYAFLKGMGLDGNLGTFTVDLAKNKMKASKGHEVVSAHDGEFEIKSSRYPFCACEPQDSETRRYPICGTDDISHDDSIRSAMTLIPFNQDLNRLTLIVTHATAPQYKVTWGGETKTFSADQLTHGINLAAEFPSSPFNEAFAKVDAAVGAKQLFETREMKTDFRPGGNLRAPLDQVVAQTEKVVADDEKKHDELAAAVHNAFVPVTHSIKISAE
ncbi:MAG TPA: SGNH/GDSL hydrolase family protein [Candidatus Polarisedimenticolia bacterium]|nr:SGNH/GDSL hydrolase family protein [Candidatus Polarisedimenticolia bacterium]